MVVRLDGLVGDGGDAAVRQRSRERLVGGDVEVREEHEPFAQPRVLGLDRLLDLEQEVGLAPGVVDRDDPGARSLVLLVGERAPLPRRRLDENLVPALDQLAGTRRGERHPVLVGLDLLRNTDTQGPETLSPRRRATKPRGTCLRLATRKHGFGTLSRVASLSRVGGIGPHPGWGRGALANSGQAAPEAC